MKKTWLNIPEDSDFSIYNLPFGIFSTKQRSKRIGIAIGNQIIDLSALVKAELVSSIDRSITQNEYLNDFIALGKPFTKRIRKQVQSLLTKKNSPLRDKKNAFVSMKSATMHLPVQVGDYTDFYSSIEHATNVGSLFRDPDKALLPNWRHIPVGYHGRASSIIASGENIRRPKGQVKPKEAKRPKYQPSARLDFELEMAFIIGKPTKLGNSITTQKAEDHIFGMVLFNDWSARDIQAWEYVPLGPFLGKNFASSVSPWVVTMEALEPFRVKGPVQKPAVQSYLKYDEDSNYDINLTVGIMPEKSVESIVCKSNFKYMYWNMKQQLAHHTVNGCNINIGDMLASGTISGKEKDSYGSMLELSWAGRQPLTLDDGSTRSFLHDGDTVTMKGYGEKDGIRVGFGEVKAKILPAK